MKSLTYLKPWHVLVILIIFNLFLGLVIGNQYGQTWDEPSFYLYGERSYDAYMRGLAGQPLIPEKHIMFLDLRYYGAFYTAIGWKLVEVLKPILKNWGYMDVWHLVNFTFFQIALVSLYFLAKRYLHAWTTLLVVVLFNVQPLVFGHAFINPKDIPFMTFFLASVALGLYMMDHVKSKRDDEKVPDTFPKFHLLLSILFGLFVLSFVCKDVIYSLASQVITAIYNAPEGSFGNTVFSFLVNSSNRLPVENYIHKAVSAHLERSLIYFLFLLLITRKIYLKRPVTLGSFLDVDYRLVTLTFVSGVVLGLATSTRLLAPFAGILIAGYALLSKGRISLPVLIYYFSLAAITSYLTWPFLWDSPTYNFYEAFQVMRDFPFNAEIRFMGDNILPSNLPWYYLPFLISVQITEPVILLAWLGFGVATSGLMKHIIDEKLLVILWLILPVGLQITLKSNMYDNFRQFLFALPPIFVLAGLGLEKILAYIRSATFKIGLAVISLVPGLIGIVSLHPIQYIYYNGFVGGVSGAEGNFELDYWLTSYREAAFYINDHASIHANILAWGSGFNGAREDLYIYSFISENDLIGMDESFEYAVISTRFFSHLNVFEDAPVVYEVRRHGVLLAVVKKLTK